MEFRFTKPEDVPQILEFIKALAAYEHLEDQVAADEDILREWLFEKKGAEVIFALHEGEPAGYALFFQSFSTFLGRGGVYLEDLFILPKYRGLGYGKGLLRALAKIALERGCGRLEWACLDWNRPSVDFYLSLGAEPLDGWTTYRLAGEGLKALGGKND